MKFGLAAVITLLFSSIKSRSSSCFEDSHIQEAEGANKTFIKNAQRQGDQILNRAAHETNPNMRNVAHRVSSRLDQEGNYASGKIANAINDSKKEKEESSSD